MGCNKKEKEGKQNIKEAIKFTLFLQFNTTKDFPKSTFTVALWIAKVFTLLYRIILIIKNLRIHFCLN